MRTALDRVLAKPSALRVLREIATTPHFPQECLLSWASCFNHRMLPQGGPVRHDHTAAQVYPTVKRVYAGRTSARQSDRREDRLDRRPLLSKYEYVHPDNAPHVQSTEINASTTVKHDYRPWIKMLHDTERQYGQHGLVLLWEELRLRGVDLPVEGHAAQIFWDTFLTTSSSYLCDRVIKYARSVKRTTGRVYSGLYNIAMGHWLSGSPDKAMRVHRMLMSFTRPAPKTLRKLARIAGGDIASLSVFRTIYLQSSERNVYDSLITPLLEDEQHSIASEWHAFLVSHGDFPSSEMMANRIVQTFEPRLPAPDNPKVSESPLTSGDAPRKDVPASSQNTLSRETMNTILGQFHRINAKDKDDSFVARLFATKMLSNSGLLRALPMLGVRAIGPLALRELALRAETFAEVKSYISHLRKMRLGVHKTVFSQAVINFAETDKAELLHDLVTCDLHPDAFEDMEVQQDLLEQYIAMRDWRQAYRTLAILTLFHEDPATESWNLLLQKYTHERDMTRLSKLLDDMRTYGIPLTTKSISRLSREIISFRRPGKRAQQTQDRTHDDLRCIINILRSILESNGEVYAERWVEVIIRLGMSGRIVELQRLIYWLLNWYAPDTVRVTRQRATPAASTPATFGPHGDPPCIPSPGMPNTDPEHPFHILFGPSFQEALITWGLRAALDTPSPAERNIRHTKAQRPPWTIGITILRTLKQRGVNVQLPLVCRVILDRLAPLYGPSESDRTSNRRMRVNNPMGFEEMIMMAEEAFGEPLLERVCVKWLLAEKRWWQTGRRGQQDGPPLRDDWVSPLQGNLRRQAEDWLRHGFKTKELERFAEGRRGVEDIASSDDEVFAQLDSAASTEERRRKQIRW